MISAYRLDDRGMDKLIRGLQGKSLDTVRLVQCQGAFRIVDALVMRRVVFDTCPIREDEFRKFVNEAGYQDIAVGFWNMEHPLIDALCFCDEGDVSPMSLDSEIFQDPNDDTDHEGGPDRASSISAEGSAHRDARDR